MRTLDKISQKYALLLLMSIVSYNKSQTYLDCQVD